jgi:hypothetical protein
MSSSSFKFVSVIVLLFYPFKGFLKPAERNPPFLGFSTETPWLAALTLLLLFYELIGFYCGLTEEARYLNSGSYFYTFL